MIVRFFKKNGFGRNNTLVEPDEIFLDSKNIGNFNQQQFEGRIEKPISKRTILFFSLLSLIIIAVFSGRLFYLQVGRGEAYLARSENNTLEKSIIFADRGIIYDRSRVELAWNRKDSGAMGLLPATRSYKSPGFAHTLGYVSYPAQDKSGNWWQSEFIGLDGLEKVYNADLEGINGAKITETDVSGETHSENVVNAPVRGSDIVTSIDWRIQGELFRLIRELAETHSFTGGAGIIMDVKNGEILAATSFPEYDAEILSLGENKERIRDYMSDSRKAFLDRTISGVYTPGSIVKPFIALGALTEGVITPVKEILSTGSISIPNPYFPDQPTIFKDWRAHGWTDMAEALAVSSDVYFYQVGGGFENQRGIGILNIEKYARLFGIGSITGVDLPDEKSGIIPTPQWKAEHFNGDPWRVGDTYNTAIGQYGFQVTPMEMARAVGAIANRGTLVTPHFILDDKNMEERVEKIDLPDEYYSVVHDGMRQAVTYGTAVALNVPYVEAAAKTGTAQLGALKNRVNSWITGFFPYDNPEYAFVVLMESGPSTGTVNASSVMRHLFDWMYWETPEYFGLPPKTKNPE